MNSSWLLTRCARNNVKISNPHPLLDPYRYFGYLFEKNAYPDVLDTCSKNNTYPVIRDTCWKKEYVSGSSESRGEIIGPSQHDNRSWITFVTCSLRVR